MKGKSLTSRWLNTRASYHGNPTTERDTWRGRQEEYAALFSITQLTRDRSSRERTKKPEHGDKKSLLNNRCHLLLRFQAGLLRKAKLQNSGFTTFPAYFVTGVLTEQYIKQWCGCVGGGEMDMHRKAWGKLEDRNKPPTQLTGLWPPRGPELLTHRPNHSSYLVLSLTAGSHGWCQPASPTGKPTAAH